MTKPNNIFSPLLLLTVLVSVGWSVYVYQNIKELYKVIEEPKAALSAPRIPLLSVTINKPLPLPKRKVELLPALVPICTCESGQGAGKPQHYNLKTGEVLRGAINPKDIGMCQINLTYHQETAAAMGLDLFVRDDNIAYANWLYEQQGASPWQWSNGCHYALSAA